MVLTGYECQKCGELSWREPTPVEVHKYRVIETTGGRRTFRYKETMFLCHPCKLWVVRQESEVEFGDEPREVKFGHASDQYVEDLLAKEHIGGHAVMWDGWFNKHRNDWGDPKPLDKGGDDEC